MRASDIKIGRTYRNRGKGTTQRKVLAIGKDVAPPHWYGRSGGPDEAGVEFEYVDDDGGVGRLFLGSFASWAGSEVSDE